jgi:hypothetical protein
MRRLADLKIAILILLTAFVAAAQRKEYFTENEIDLIRDAQYQSVELGTGKELPLRVGVYLRLADLRLAALGLKEKTAKERELEKKADEQHRKEVRDAQRAGKAGPKAPEQPDDYLADFTRTELLRGYIEALDEVMDNIDDYYRRKLDVRGPLEDLAKYAKEQLPIVKTFQPKNNAETSAREDAVEITQKVIDDTREALEIVPKTEKTERAERPDKPVKKP